MQATVEIETPRLNLISPSLEMAEEVLHFQLNNLNWHKPWMPIRSESHFTIQHQETIIAEQLKEQNVRSGLCLLILLKGSDVMIGKINFSNIIWGTFQSSHLGYSIDQNSQGKGFMTEAISSAVNFIFDDWKLHRVEANVIPRNVSSIRVLEKLQFVNEGLSPKYLKINGRWEDHFHYVKRNTELE